MKICNRFPMEIHLVHLNPKYPSIAAAKASINDPTALAVISVLCEVRSQLLYDRYLRCLSTFMEKNICIIECSRSKKSMSHDMHIWSDLSGRQPISGSHCSSSVQSRTARLKLHVAVAACCPATSSVRDGRLLQIRRQFDYTWMQRGCHLVRSPQKDPDIWKTGDNEAHYSSSERTESFLNPIVIYLLFNSEYSWQHLGISSPRFSLQRALRNFRFSTTLDQLNLWMAVQSPATLLQEALQRHAQPCYKIELSLANSSDDLPESQLLLHISEAERSSAWVHWL